MGMQKFGLISNFLGSLLFGFGVLDGSRATWGDVAKISCKAVWIRRFAWIGLAMIVAGFFIQLSRVN